MNTIKNAFVDAIDNQEARTLNDMKARKSTANANVDLFFKIGASRGKDVIPQFVAALLENPFYALRIALWTRDIREGAGERQLFKNILIYMEKNHPEAVKNIINKIPLLGRWDDMLINYTDKSNELFAFYLIKQALQDNNGLCAKWMPRKGPQSIKLREYLGLTPKKYRKLLVNLTNVVETQMCAKEWNKIDYSSVPSLAHSRYKTAFYRNSEESYTNYVDALVKGDPTVKINAGAVYPYDVIKQLNMRTCKSLSKVEQDVIDKQWEALPDFIGDENVFPMVDVSGSMGCSAGNNGNLTCMNVAISLGMYLADKNKGALKDCFLTFSESPQILKIQGTVTEKYRQMITSRWGMNTNLHKAFDELLKMANQNMVPEYDMPKMLLILSDMQFDRCVQFDDQGFQMIQRKYKAAGYQMPKIVFWNLNAYDNAPVEFTTQGTALISGFSPSIMKSVLKADMEKFTPESIMLETIMNSRYDI